MVLKAGQPGRQGVSRGGVGQVSLPRQGELQLLTWLWGDPAKLLPASGYPGLWYLVPVRFVLRCDAAALDKTPRLSVVRLHLRS